MSVRVCVSVHVCVCVYLLVYSQGSWVFISTMWVLGVKLRLSSLVISCSTSEPSGYETLPSVG